MNEAVERMLQRYQSKSLREQERALREILQEIALVGLWRSKFFDTAAFYGGTALRILYGLDRFSEDLDFTLLKPNQNFSWKPYLEILTEELASYGFSVSMEEKVKSKETAIRSAFLKANTLETMLLIGQQAIETHPETLIRIRIEVDTDPPVTFTTESHYLRDPLPVPIVAVAQSELFASKVYTALYRVWKNRVKGRDWYDLIWFIRREIKLDIHFLENYMRATQAIKNTEKLDPDMLNSLLVKRISNIDFGSLLTDLRPFVKDESILKDWTVDFFKSWFQRIQYTS